MAGIYIHIPFCKRKCHYCNFFSLATRKFRTEFLASVSKEIALQKNYLGNEEIHSIYFGGGTPSILQPSEIASIISELKKFHPLDESAEITLEANPDDLDKPYLNELSLTPVNRLSIGIQSFYDDDLVYLNRVHSARHGMDCIRNALDIGFSNLSIDLIYGIPILTNKKWISNLEKTVTYGIPHISAYALTVEPKTTLQHFIKHRKYTPVNEEQTVSHFNRLCDFMSKQGYQHYEISNFCKDGWHSRHNTSYWKGEKYLGLGPSAHSFNGSSRQWNAKNLSIYIQLVDEGTIPSEREILTPVQRYNEYVMTSLRTMWGIDQDVIRERFGEEFLIHFKHEAEEYIKSRMIQSKEGKYILTQEGMLMADRIASDLFMTDD
jgi:oxygen-independent coproporphyrinogen-3 oxidase